MAITWKSIFGRGMKDLAKDPNVTDDELAQAAAEAHKLQSSTARARAADADDPAIEAPPDEDVESAGDKRRGRDRRGKDKRSRDADPAIEAPPDKDVEPADDRKRRLHDALDRVMDRSVADADMEELKDLLGEFLSEEEAEPEHQDVADDEPADTSELEQIVADTIEAPGEEVVESGEEELEDRHMDDKVAEEDAEEEEEVGDCAGCGAPMEADDAFCSKCGDKRADDRRHGKDRARAADGAMAVLKIMRPFVARSNDRALKATFNSALSTATRGSRASTSSYRAFAGAARARDNAPRSRAHDTAAGGDGDRIAKLQAAYDAARKGGK